jgi:Phage integrase family
MSTWPALVQVVEQAAEVAGKIIVSPPKTDAGRRVVTLPRVAVEALAAHLEEYAEPGLDGLVFTTPRGAYLLRSPFNRFVWRPAVEQVGLDGLRVHDLRHTAATLAAAAGATTKELMERMGHTSPAVALRYQHVMVDRQAALALALDDLARLATAPAKGTVRARRARRGHGGVGRGVALMVARSRPGTMVERVTGIEPASRAWKARALPLSYTRVVAW